MYLSDAVEGEFELKPVRLNWSRGDAGEYPHVLKLFPVDTDLLLREYEAAMPSLSSQYLEERKLAGELVDVVRILKDHGFYDGYVSTSLTAAGLGDYRPGVGVYTRALFDGRLAPACRIHYALAKPGWETKWHRDCEHFRRHGFRVLIPLTASTRIAFQEDGKEIEYELTAGHAWFVNNARMHKASNTTAVERKAILAQLMDDSGLKPGVDSALVY